MHAGGTQIRLGGSFKFICLKSRNFFAYFHIYLDFSPTLENFNLMVAIFQILF